MDSKNHVYNLEIIAFVDTSVHSKDAIFKCLYWYGDKFRVDIRLHNGSSYKISLIPLDNSGILEADLQLYLEKLERDLIDFSLRDTVTKETKNIRDLLIAKAFSNGEFDELPPGEITDPVGFNINI